MALCPRAKRFRLARDGSVCRARRALDFGPTDPSVAVLIPDLFPEGSNQKKVRRRTVFTRQQKVRLERSFRADRYPNSTVKKELAQEFGLPVKKIQTWFKNRRAKSKQHSTRFAASLLPETPGSFMTDFSEPSLAFPEMFAYSSGPVAAPHIFATAAELQEWPVPPTPNYSMGAMETVAMAPFIPCHFPAATMTTWMDDGSSGAVRNLFGQHFPSCQATLHTPQPDMDAFCGFFRQD